MKCEEIYLFINLHLLFFEVYWRIQIHVTLKFKLKNSVLMLIFEIRIRIMTYGTYLQL